jgi:SAM-dependent methyltransferase
MNGPSNTLIPPSPDEARRLRDFFAQAGYTPENLRDNLGFTDLPSRRLRNLPRLWDRTSEPTTVHTLLRWFLVGVPIENQKAREFVSEEITELFLNCGLVVEQDEQLAPTVLLMPYDEFLIASDQTTKFDSPDPSDFVLWPNPTSRLLYRFAIQRLSRATLDLGTGNGIVAFWAKSHSDRVVASDLNPRATEFAAFNARLNGLEGIEFLTGDRFEPVAGQTFDLIVTNPPFFITPSRRHLFCDNSFDLDGLCRRIVGEAPRYLNEDGYLQMLCEWAEVRGQPWQERVAGWFEGSGCDAWIMKGLTQDPSAYAEERIRGTAPDSPEGDAALYAEYMNYYRQRNVEAIHNGLIAMRRRSGKNWIMVEEGSHTPKDPFGESILQTFLARDFLQSHASDEDVLAARPSLSRHARLEQQLQQVNGAWEQTSLQLRLTKGFPFFVGVQPLVAEFLSHCDGSHTLEELTRHLAAKANASLGQVQKECLEVIRKLIERGFVVT